MERRPVLWVIQIDTKDAKHMKKIANKLGFSHIIKEVLKSVSKVL